MFDEVGCRPAHPKPTRNKRDCIKNAILLHVARLQTRTFVAKWYMHIYTATQSIQYIFWFVKWTLNTVKQFIRYFGALCFLAAAKMAICISGSQAPLNHWLRSICSGRPQISGTLARRRANESRALVFPSFLASFLINYSRNNWTAYRRVRVNIYVQYGRKC